MDSAGSLRAVEQAYQELLERHQGESEEARSARRRAFSREHQELGRSYGNIAAEVALDRSRVIRIINGK